MAMYGGVNGAVKKLYPWGGHGNAKKRFLRSKCGVNNAVKTCQFYLDEIDHVEVEFYDCVVYTNLTSEGGTKVCEGKSNFAKYGSISFSGRQITMNFKGGTANYTGYTHFRVWLVLKDGYKLRASYPYNPDGKSCQAVLKQVRFTHNTSAYWYPWIWLWDDGINEGTSNKSVTVHCDSTSYSGGIRLKSYYASTSETVVVEIGTITINGVAYTPTVINNIA